MGEGAVSLHCQRVCSYAALSLQWRFPLLLLHSCKPLPCCLFAFERLLPSSLSPKDGLEMMTSLLSPGVTPLHSPSVGTRSGSGARARRRQRQRRRPCSSSSLSSLLATVDVLPLPGFAQFGSLNECQSDCPMLCSSQEKRTLLTQCLDQRRIQR